MNDKKSKFIKSILFTVFGLFFLVLSSQYKLGTNIQPGPGWVPFYLSIVLICIGLYRLISTLLHDR